MSRRVYVVGTDTEVGKTALCCALLRQAREQGLRIVPFKPAQSGEPGLPSDAERLLAAAGLPATDLDAICPLRYDVPVAPGIAADPAGFFKPAAANAEPHPQVLERVEDALHAWEQRTRAELVLIEGAGGLHVPMPGGTWQPQWIAQLSSEVVVVGRAGLGTINHTLLTIDALRALGCAVLGFYLVQTSGVSDPSVSDNASVIAAARGVLHLGTLPFCVDPDRAQRAGLLNALLG